MILPTYKSLEEKKEHFSHYRKINTVEELEKEMRKLEEDQTSLLAFSTELVFRGVKEAKYKLYTSAQRDWITNEWEKLGISFVDFIDRQLYNLKKDKVLMRYFESIDIAVNDLLLLSFLQHYGAPAPLLDFTYNILISLFFAATGTEPNKQGFDDIENYLSVYAISVDKRLSIDIIYNNALRDYQEKNLLNRMLYILGMDPLKNMLAWKPNNEEKDDQGFVRRNLREKRVIEAKLAVFKKLIKDMEEKEAREILIDSIKRLSLEMKETASSIEKEVKPVIGQLIDDLMIVRGRIDPLGQTISESELQQIKNGVYHPLPNTSTDSRGRNLIYDINLFLPNPLYSELPDALAKLSWSNPNIIAQEGCFILNSHESSPLNERADLPGMRMTCLDIHKSLAPYIREEYLKSKGITKESIYPDFNAIANEAYEAFQRDPLGKSLQPDLSDSKD
jgi:FRG domain